MKFRTWGLLSCYSSLVIIGGVGLDTGDPALSRKREVSWQQSEIAGRSRSSEVLPGTSR
jgi:hypothetical protein